MRFLLLAVLFMGFATPSFAGCYSRAEAEAEQGLRIHSELMIIGLNCMGIVKDPQLYSKYHTFTRQNVGLINGWESTMIRYFDRNGGKGETQFHDFRTRMANAISTDVAHMRPDVFCFNNVNRIYKALKMSSAEVQNWASTPHRGVPSSKPLCASTGR